MHCSILDKWCEELLSTVLWGHGALAVYGHKKTTKSTDQKICPKISTNSYWTASLQFLKMLYSADSSRVVSHLEWVPWSQTKQLPCCVAALSGGKFQTVWWRNHTKHILGSCFKRPICVFVFFESAKTYINQNWHCFVSWNLDICGDYKFWSICDFRCWELFTRTCWLGWWSPCSERLETDRVIIQDTLWPRQIINRDNVCGQPWQCRTWDVGGCWPKTKVFSPITSRH